MRNIITVALLIGYCCCGCLPIPHYRLHAYGVTGKIVTEAGDPVPGATLAGKYHTDQNGCYRIPPQYGLHGAIAFVPLRLSLLPGWDMTSPTRRFQVSARGCETTSCTITAGLSYCENARVDGSYLRADDIHLQPVKTQDSALRTQD